MSSVLGVSVGAATIRVARPQAGNSTDVFDPDRFDLQSLAVDGRSMSDVAAEAVVRAQHSTPDLVGTTIAYPDQRFVRLLRATLTREQAAVCTFVPEVAAAVEFLRAADELPGYRTVAICDLGSSGMSVNVVDITTGQVHVSERTGDISGDHLDTLVREQQIASGRIPQPTDQSGLAALDDVCRQAKEQLTETTAVALPSASGLVLLSQENFESLITLAVESSARVARDAIMRSELSAQAVVMIGGGAYIPLVSRTMARWTGLPVMVPARPELVVARGAALLARHGGGPAVVESAIMVEPAIMGETVTQDLPRDIREVEEDMAPVWLSPPSQAKRELLPGRRRELSVAGVAVGALIVIAALGSLLGWGPHVLQGDPQSKTQPTAVPPTTPSSRAPVREAPAPPPPPLVSETTTAPPPPPARGQQPPPEAPTTSNGPNTIVVVPGLPPLVVPTIPPVVIPGMPGARQDQPQR